MKNALVLHGTGANAQTNWFPWLKEELEKRGWSNLLIAIDPYSRVGRLFRRLKPSPEQKALNAAFSGKKEYKMISRRFLEEMKRRYQH